MQSALVHKPSGQVVLVFNGWPKAGDYEVLPVAAPDTPTGKRRVGQPEFLFNRQLGIVEKYERFEDEITPPTAAEKLDRFLNIAGLTVGELKRVLGVSAERGSRPA